ncbi:MAG: transcription elongation factor GreA [Lachnospiraceae bacterium]|jgi:transcription elongation factor GreA|nr:transcription elongation factor GreA [Lachnospiraceae bacterium]
MEDNKPVDRFTRKQLRVLESRLADLKAKSHEIAQRIKEAREQGDLSENSEYDSAMDDQRKNEGEIVELEALLNRAVVIDKIDTKHVSVGCLVTVMNITKNRESTYEIVGSPILVDVLMGKISDASPVGKGLYGAKTGQEVTVELPAGPVVYKILSIAKPEEEGEATKPARKRKA